MTLQIHNRMIGPGLPTLVIAEIGVNHDGSVRRALELVRYAAQAGADAVKLQIFKARSLLHPSCGLAGYQRSCASDALAMLKRYELSKHQLKQVVRTIRDHGLIPLATPFSPEDLELIHHLELPAVKIASPDLVNRPLLQRAAVLGKPMIVSTGAATMQEVERAVGWLKDFRASFALMHCVSSYPTPTGQANLCWIRELQRFGVPVGYSDHTTELRAGALAVAFGACIVEKHLTCDRRASGPDHAASADPRQFARYVRLIRLADEMHGQPGKRLLPIEQDCRMVSRQSLVLRRDLVAGQIITADDLAVQRPGTGISAADIDHAIGKSASRPLTRGTLLQWDMLCDAA